MTFACINENVGMCERLIISKANVNHIDKCGRNHLMNCCQYNKEVEVIELLIQNGADVQHADFNHNTCLHYAALRGSKVVAQFLLK